MGTNGERCIKKQHALLSPTGKIARCRNFLAQISLYLFKDILERWRELYAVLYRETQSVGLSRLMIRVLTNDNNLNLIKRAQVKGIENQLTWRIAGCSLILLSHSSSELRKVRFIKLVLQILLPRFFYLYVHNCLKISSIITCGRIFRGSSL